MPQQPIPLVPSHTPKSEWVDDPEWVDDEPQQSEPLIKKAWTAATTPHFDIRGPQTEWQTPEAQAWLREHPTLKKIGDIGNVGLDLVSGLSSSLNMAFGGLGAGEAAAARLGLPAAARLARIGRRALSVPVVAEGAQQLYKGYEEGSPLQGVIGGIELAGGLLGMGKGPKVEPKVEPTVTPKPSLPEGWTAEVGKTPVDATGRPYEAQTDFANKKVVYSHEDHLKNPDINAHETAHINIETKPPDLRAQLMKEYLGIKVNTPEWQMYKPRQINKPDFQNESLAMDLANYYKNPAQLDPKLRSLFDRAFKTQEPTQPMLPLETKKPLVPEPASKDYIRQQLARTDELAREEIPPPVEQPVTGELDTRITGLAPESADVKLIRERGKLTLADLGNDPEKIANYAKYLRGEPIVEQPLGPDQWTLEQINQKTRDAEQNILASPDTYEAVKIVDDLRKQFGPPEFTPTSVGGGRTEAAAKLVPPQTIGQLIRGIPFTGNPEFDNLAAQVKRLRDKGGLTDSELDQFGNLVDQMRAHPAMPPELNTLWDEIGARNLANPPKFAPGTQVRIKEPSVATSRPTLVQGKSVKDLADLDQLFREEGSSLGAANKTGIGEIYSDGTVRFKNLEGRNPFYTNHSDIDEFRGAAFPRGSFRYGNGRVYWNEKPTLEELYAVEDHLINSGLEVKSHHPWQLFFEDNPKTKYTVSTKGGKFKPLLIEESSEARIPGTNRFKMSVSDEQDVVDIMANTYSGNPGATATKELLQNAIDELAPGGRVLHPDAKIDVSYNQETHLLRVVDNGNGIPFDLLTTKFIDIAGSGKRGQVGGTIGEQGVGKVTYFTKGKRVNVSTVVREPDGRLMKYDFTATPEEIKRGGFEINETPAPEGTPTGTVMEMELPESQNSFYIEKYVAALGRHSDLAIPISYKTTYKDYRRGERILENFEFVPHSPKERELLTSGETPGAKFSIYKVKGGGETEGGSIALRLVNRGMYQGTENVYTIQGVKVPEELVVDINPKVIATHPDYPLTPPTRERMRGTIQEAVQKAIDKEITEGAIAARRKHMESLFRQLAPRPGKKFAVVDVDERYTPEEIARFEDSPVLSKIHDLLTEHLNELHTMFKDEVLGDYYTIGFTTDLRGINVRNPGNHKQYSIFLNPASLFRESANTREASDIFTHVMIHEFTHMIERTEGADYTAALATVMRRLGTERQFEIAKRFEKVIGEGYADFRSSPDIQELLSISEEAAGREAGKRNVVLTEEGSKLPSSKGPKRPPENFGPGGGGTLTDKLGAAINQALDNIDEQLGIYRVERAQKFARARGVKAEGEDWARQFMGSLRGAHTRVVQEPLKLGQGEIDAIYSAIKNFKPAIKDFEAVTDVPLQAHAITGMTKILYGTEVPQTNEIAALQQIFPQLADTFARYHGPLEGQSIPKADIRKTSVVSEIVNLPRAIQSSWDLSAPFRQGLGLIHTRPWWTNWGTMVKAAGSEAAYRGVIDEILSRDNFRTFRDATGRVQKSLAQRAGLKLTDLTELSKREEVLMSTWAEKIPLVRASNRAYTAFLDKIRADNFDNLIRQAEKSGLNPKQDIVLAKAIANFINNASGRGSLEFEIPSRLQPLFGTNQKGAPIKEISLERSAVILNGLFFSPRLMASRLQMLNPANYIFGSSFVRKQYVKSLTGMAIAWTSIASLAKLAGAQVNLDPNNADFGKIRIGNTRIDPAGGFQQYLVLIHRLMSGKYTSSQTNKTKGFGQGYGTKTRLDAVQDFFQNKLSPVPGYAAGVLGASKYQPFNVPDETIRMVVPMFIQDLSEVAQSDPDLLPLVGLGAIGMGVQTYGNRGQNLKFIPGTPNFPIPSNARIR